MQHVIDDPEFTDRAFFQNPFRWVDPAQFRRMTVGFGHDALVEVNPIEGYPNLFNGIAMDGKSYLLVQIEASGHSAVLGSSSCRHLVLNTGGKIGLSSMPRHQSVMASVLTMSQRDVSAFSPMIQVRAIVDASSKSWGTMNGKNAHDLLLTMLGRLRDAFVETPDASRKCYVFYYMLYVACHLDHKPLLFDPYFKDAQPMFVYQSLKRMKEFAVIHDAVRERGPSLVKVAAKVFPQPYCDASFSLQIDRGYLFLTDRAGMITRADTALMMDGPRTPGQVGYRRRGRPPKLEPRANRVGQPVKRKARKERHTVLTGKYHQSLITNWSRGIHQLPRSGNNKCPGVVVEGEASTNMKNVKMADRFIDYLLASSGEVGEWVAQQSDQLTTMKDRRAFVKAIYKRAGKQLSAKKYEEWALKFINSMIRDEFLNKEAQGIVSNWGVSHGETPRVKRTVFTRLLNRLANIYVPAS